MRKIHRDWWYAELIYRYLAEDISYVMISNESQCFFRRGPLFSSIPPPLPSSDLYPSAILLWSAPRHFTTPNHVWKPKTMIDRSFSLKGFSFGGQVVNQNVLNDVVFAHKCSVIATFPLANKTGAVSEISQIKKIPNQKLIWWDVLRSTGAGIMMRGIFLRTLAQIIVQFTTLMTVVGRFGVHFNLRIQMLGTVRRDQTRSLDGEPNDGQWKIFWEFGFHLIPVEKERHVIRILACRDLKPRHIAFLGTSEPAKKP